MPLSRPLLSLAMSVMLTALVVIISLGMTLYFWQMSSRSSFVKSQLEFESLILESEKALLYGIESYNHAVLGGIGFFQGSTYVSREEWKNYVATVDIKRNFPGISGIGVIKPVEPQGLPEFLKQRKDERGDGNRSEEHTSELQSQSNLVCRLL